MPITPRADEDFAEDTKKVRRKDAPKLRPYRTGTAAEALRTAACPKRRRKAKKKLMKNVYALTTVGARRSRLRMVKSLLRAAGHRWLPITADALEDVAASLRNHRSIENYLSDWRREHIKAGHAWTDGLQELRKDVLRAATRGQGPPRRAQTFGAEQLPNETQTDEPPVVDGGPLWPWLMLVVAVCWLLRDAETAALLGEQASVDPVRREASLDLGPTKVDVKGRGCIRTLGCLCGSGLRGPCPYCALESLLAARRAAGWDDKDPLFPAQDGHAPRAAKVVQTWRILLKLHLSGHSARREGAQMYGRRDVMLYLIQFLGRWGSDTVAKYVGEALRGQLARAATARTAGLPSPGVEATPQHLRRTIEEIVEEALKARQDKEEIIQKIRMDVDAAPAIPGAPAFGCKHQVQGMKSDRPQGLIHDVLLMDPCIPRSAWVTRCSWRFGETEHRLMDGVPISCSRCLQQRHIICRSQVG